MVKKMALTFGVSVLGAAYKAFVLMLMWNWFVSPVFHTGSISFWQVLGLLWLVQLFVGLDTDENPANTARWENLFLVLDACVPEEKRDEVKELFKQKNEAIWGQLGVYIFGQFVGYTLTLVLGWAVHTFFV